MDAFGQLVDALVSIVRSSPAKDEGDVVDLPYLVSADRGAAFDVCIGKVIDYEILLPDDLMSAIAPYEEVLLDEDVHDLHEVQKRLRAAA